MGEGRREWERDEALGGPSVAKGRGPAMALLRLQEAEAGLL